MERTIRALMVVVVIGFVFLGALGCGSPEGPENSGVSWQERLGALDHDVGAGATGDDVAAIHAYLSTYGYFPNGELARTFPRWRPIVSRAPRDPLVFDEQMAVAVAELQRRAGLTQTGIVDEATRGLLRTDRCGFPDGNPPDPSEKFAHTPSSWGNPAPTLTWKVNNANDVTIDQAKAAARAAFATWAASTSLTFQEVSGSTPATINIDFSTAFGSESLTLAQTTFPGAGDMIINSHKTWTVSGSPQSGEYDLQSLMLHELGHALGLDHSTVDVVTAVNSPIMWASVPSQALKRTLKADDQRGISSLYDTWESIPGGAQGRDIALNWVTGPQATVFIWRVGTDSAPGGFNVYRLNGSTWQLATGGRGATGIAVDGGGRPWIVDSSGNTYRRTSSLATSGTWEQIPGCAQDIGIAPLTSDTWKIDCQAAANGHGGIIKKWDPSANNWISTTGGGRRISVTQVGIPYVVDVFGIIWQRNSSDPAVDSWSSYPGCGVDIAASGSWLWVLGCDTGAFGNGVYLWNAQNSDWHWFGGAVSIALDAQAKPWVTSSDFSMWRNFK
jgi:peptidoglycan hydrolase-like protein with peptidoglycan-binding domain